MREITIRIICNSLNRNSGHSKWFRVLQQHESNNKAAMDRVHSRVGDNLKKNKYEKSLLKQEFQGVAAMKFDNSMGDTSCKLNHNAKQSEKEDWEVFKGELGQL